MADYKVVISETGVMALQEILEKYLDEPELLMEAGAFLPLPDHTHTAQRVEEVARYLVGLGKDKLMFLQPELAVLEALGARAWPGEVLVVLPAELSGECEGRIRANLPRGVRVTLLREPSFPRDFRPDNGAMVVFGYASENRGLIYRPCYRMLEAYRNYLGEKVLISCLEGRDSCRPIQWVGVQLEQFFTQVYRDESEQKEVIS